MKKPFLLFLSIIILSCTSSDDKPNEQPDILGKWKIIEQLIDPGDGSGTFNPVNSDRTIEFFSNGTVIVNGELCYLTTEVGEESSGTYSKTGTDDTFYNGEIIPNDCDYNETKVYYVLENNSLILWYLCIEGCGQKFDKI